MIKYLGSKRLLVGTIGDLAEATGAQTALDLFTGTTRVARELKLRGMTVTAADIATYSHVLAQTYIGTDAMSIDKDALNDAVTELNRLPGHPGYFTETFCRASRFVHPDNGARVDAIRDRIEDRYRDSWLYPVLLTSLLEATDRVDSTTGLQMAYLKQWAPRALQPMELRVPDLLAGPGTAVLGDANRLVTQLPQVDLAYLDPPYNQHRYFTNYHVWETLVRWDSPSHYGVACKREDAREERTKSDYNRKARMPVALAELVGAVRADVVILSYNNESWLTREQLEAFFEDAGYEDLTCVTVDHKRYVGAQIGIHNPQGRRVGRVSHLRNKEYLFVAGPRSRIARVREQHC
ncbi:MAG: DNA adenine methylase [Actinobacteria bacterium]|nr:DNA adenine methylase [Actinomycetota bacterium]